ncbi:MAG: hypothetical protein JXB05_22100, partial [Myxococcaceae bacterium]|nr:hypothetical protein [Myxococcaceae bacterium]
MTSAYSLGRLRARAELAALRPPRDTMEDVPTPDSLAPGEFVGPWRLEGRVGRGTYGVVYRARLAGHPESEPVALKMALFPDDPRFVREVKLLSTIVHPGVPGFVDRG